MVLLSAFFVACRVEETYKELDPDPPEEEGVQIKLRASPDVAWDATPLGDTVVFTGTVGGKTGLFAVDSVPPILEVAEPVAVVSSSDGSSAYVGDAATDQVFSSTGIAVTGTEGLGLQALDLLGDDLYILGVRDGKSSLYKMALSSGSPELLGEADAVLSGVVVAQSGVAYAAGRSSGGEGVVYRYSGGVTSVLNQGTETGEPAGIELTPDESLLLVSALSPAEDGSLHSNVLLVDVATGEGSLLNHPTLAENVGSGGLHQSQTEAGFYAWCGYTGSGKGGVYGVGL